MPIFRVIIIVQMKLSGKRSLVEVRYRLLGVAYYKIWSEFCSKIHIRMLCNYDVLGTKKYWWSAKSEQTHSYLTPWFIVWHHFLTICWRNPGEIVTIQNVAQSEVLQSHLNYHGAYRNPTVTVTLTATVTESIPFL